MAFISFSWVYTTQQERNERHDYEVTSKNKSIKTNSDLTLVRKPNQSNVGGEQCDVTLHTALNALWFDGFLFVTTRVWIVMFYSEKESGILCVTAQKSRWYRWRITVRCICVAFCIFVCVWPHTRRIQSVSVLSEYDYLVVSAMD